MDRREVLGQGAEIGVLAVVSGGAGSSGERAGLKIAAREQGELVEELANGDLEILTLPRPLGHDRDRLCERAIRRRVLGEPILQRAFGHGAEAYGGPATTERSAGA